MVRGDEPLPLLQRFCALVLRAGFCGLGRFRASGLEHIPRSGPVIIAANHSSWIDPLLLFLAAEPIRPICFAAKAELFRNPLAASFLHGSRVFPLERKGDVGALLQTVDILKRGGCLGFFPEGTRSRSGVPRDPKPGIGFLAAASMALVVPARLMNTGRFPFAGAPEMKCGPGLRFSGNSEDHEQCRAFAREVMCRVFEL